MPSIEPTSRISQRSLEDKEDLSKELDKTYEKLAGAVNTKGDLVANEDTAPSATVDADFEIGTMWVKEDSDQVYILTSKAFVAGVLTGTWTEVS
jgi:hypothetical protein